MRLALKGDLVPIFNNCCTDLIYIDEIIIDLLEKSSRDLESH